MNRIFVVILCLLLSLISVAKPIHGNVAADGIEGVEEEVESTAIQYVQEGLVHLLDGIENGGFGIHNEGSTKLYPWTDCISGTIITPSDRVFLTDAGIALSTTFAFPGFDWNMKDETEFTVEYVVLLEGGSDSNGSFVRGNDSSMIYYPLISRANKNADGVRCIAGAYNNAVRFTTGVGNNRLACYALFTMSPDKNRFGVGVNGQDIEVKETTNSKYIFPMPSSTVEFADYSDIDSSTGLKQSRLYAIRCYNRVLTDEEIQHNYELDCQRFNLD